MLDKLWDDTVAGPRPDYGLGKLRKFRSMSGKDLDVSGDEPMRVSRTIMIVKPPGVQTGSTPPVSPAGSTPPVSPFSGGSRRGAYLFGRSSASIPHEKTVQDTPTGARGTSSP